MFGKLETKCDPNSTAGEKRVSLEFQIAGAEATEFVAALREENIDYKLTNRKGFDGIAVASLVVSVVTGIGGIITPIILHMLSSKEPDEVEITINGITISGLSGEQIGNLIEDLAHERR